MKTAIKTFVIYSCLTVFLPSLSYAQSNGDIQLAKAQLWVAQDLYEAGNYSEALIKVEAAEETMGSAGAQTLLLKAKTFYKLNRYEDAKTTISQFYNYNPSENSQREIAKLVVGIDEKVRAQRAAKAEAERTAKTEADRRQRQAESDRLKRDQDAKNKAERKRLVAEDIRRFVASVKTCGTAKECLSFRKFLNGQGEGRTFKSYHIKSEERNNLKFITANRACNRDSPEGCYILASEYKGDENVRRTKILEACEANYARACYLIGIAKSLEFVSIYGGRFDLSNTGGYKLFLRSDYVSETPYSHKKIKEGLVQGLPYLEKACLLNEMSACQVAYDEGIRKKYKISNKKMRRNIKKHVCMVAPNTKLRKGLTNMGRRICE